jgi:RNA polymerase sigma-B factor
VVTVVNDCFHPEDRHMAQLKCAPARGVAVRTTHHAPQAAWLIRATALVTEMANTPADDPGRAALRARAIEAWLGWAYRHAHRYAGRSQPVEDLRQVAALGLVNAVDRFNPAVGESFTPYATTVICGELKRYFRDHGWAMRVPRRMQELALAVGPARERLSRHLQRTPTVDELAEAVGVTPEDLLDALDAADHYRLVSLQTPRSLNGSIGELGDAVGAADPRLESAADRLALGTLVRELTPRERTILTLRFIGEKTQSEIGEQLGISQMHVSRLIRRILDRLRDELVTG